LPTRARIEDDNAPQIIAQADFPSTPISGRRCSRCDEVEYWDQVLVFQPLPHLYTFTEAIAEPLDSRSPDRSSPCHREDPRRIPAGELTLQNMESFNDQPIARGVGDTATDAIKTMWPLQWRAPRNG
jgi:hypothetical protein